MNRRLIRSTAFARDLKRFLKRNPEKSADIEQALQRLIDNAFDPKLKTHKLRGTTEDSWSCSAGYDVRLIFQFLSGADEGAILLQSVGTHDEVYD